MSPAARLLSAEWRSGQLWLLLVSVAIAVATVAAIGLFASRVERSLLSEAGSTLAGDAQVRGTQPIPPEWLARAGADGLSTSQATYFRAMAFKGDIAQLTLVKAVDDAYPLKGELQVAERPDGAVEAVRHGPEPGTIWLAPRLFDLLGVTVGDTLELASAQLTVARVLVKEPDNAQSLFAVAPRVMINRADVAATGAVAPGSRVNYGLMLAGDESAVSEFGAALAPELGAHHRWVTVADANEGIASALTRATRFLYLSGSLGVLLAAVAIALAGRRYAERRVSQVALLKTLGLGPRAISRLYAIQLLALGLLGTAAGLVLGYGLHLVIVWLLAQLTQQLAPPSWLPLGIAALTGAIALLGFAGPPLWWLKKVPPAVILREGNRPPAAALVSHALIGLACTLLLIGLYSRSPQLTLIIAAGAGACLLLALALARVFAAAVSRVGRHLGRDLRLGFANLERHRRANTSQIALFGTLFMLLFTLILVRTSLLDSWREQLPPDAPNHFIFNLFDDDRPALDQAFAEADITPGTYFPMLRGRLVALNERPLAELVAAQTNQVDYEREFYLTWADTLGDDNTIVAGRWWASPPEQLEVSVEEEFAKGLNAKIGDTVVMSLSGIEVSARLASIREVQWDSMNPNFYVIYSGPIVDGPIANWITSFYLPPERKGFINELTRAMPAVTLVELDQTLAEVRRIIDRVSQAIQFIWALVLAAGVLVLITSVQSTLDERLQEGAVLRTLGAGRRLIRTALATEFASIGLLAGLLATAAAELIVWRLQTVSFNLDYQLHPLLWVLGPLATALLITLVGLASTRRVTQVAPLTLLRNL